MCETVRNVLMMRLVTDKGVVLDVFVKPDSQEFKIEVKDEEITVYCRESPVKGKVNKELVKELSRIFKRRIEIAAGFTSKQKKILIPNISMEESNEILSTYKS
jgi:uncharacterized protein (TIGR00251 family)